MTTRRRALGWLGAVGGLAVLPAAGFAGYLYADTGRSNVGELTFRNRLGIPPLLSPSVAADGVRRFRLTLAEGRTELLPGTTTRTWGANGPILGPTLRARRGDRVAVDVRNDLPETTSLHWHGMHLPARMDGGPHQPIEPGATWRPSWTIEQPAATLWYHPHLHRSTAAHVYRGVAGLFLVNDDPAVRLPEEYGVDDIPLIVQDRKIADDGTLDESDLAFGGLTITGLLGDKILVNGTYDPYVEVVTERIRLRLLNGCNARILYVGFTDDRRFSLVATDAGLLRTPQPLRRLLLSPGERAEVVVEFRGGEAVVLRSFPAPLGTNPIYARLAGGSDTLDLLKMTAATVLRPSAPVPAELTPVAPAPTATRAPPFRLEMGDFLLNGATMDAARIDRVVRAGSVEVWVIVNGQAIPHNFHVHGASFHVLDVDGAPPAVELRGAKDTVYVPPGSAVRLAVRFLDHSDARSPYMFHCHVLAHEDAGMMGQFLTVSAQDEPSVPGILDDSHTAHGG
ncbi:multicopper oxidase domain-containing protein [Micromonospora sp. CPCC 205539]|uniref:multicopper oxidase family protein n=1 Tax=Micromonospora sp. CPCC 205539 TaxID=3122408 RepID=UPI002FF20121